MSLSNSQALPIPSECLRLERLYLASGNEIKFFEETILKNLFSLEKHENVTLVLYPTGHINLENMPKEMFEAVEKILERKAKTEAKEKEIKENQENYLKGIDEDSFSEENLR